MKAPTAITLLLAAFVGHAFSQFAAPKPPIGVPADAQFFNGRWYRVYLEQVTWPAARDKCKRLGGHLAVVPNEKTHAFLKELKPDLGLWLGATDEKLEGQWIWEDGTEMKFKAWAGGEPAGAKKENYLFQIHGAWEDHSNGRPQVVGYICEWVNK